MSADLFATVRTGLPLRNEHFSAHPTWDEADAARSALDRLEEQLEASSREVEGLRGDVRTAELHYESAEERPATLEAALRGYHGVRIGVPGEPERVYVYDAAMVDAALASSPAQVQHAGDGPAGSRLPLGHRSAGPDSSPASNRERTANPYTPEEELDDYSEWLGESSEPSS